MNKEESQQKTKERFEHIFQQSRSEYERQTKQDDTIIDLINALHIKEGSHVVDLGTGTGYLAFHIAKLYPETHVTGADIVELALESNRQKAADEGIKNINFTVTDGVHLPFEDDSIDCLVTRFALHHFVDIKNSFMEFARILKPGGQLFISDPTPNENDKDKLVDRFMQLVPDGHITFYRKPELDAIAETAGFVEETHYISQLRFPSKSRTKCFHSIEKDFPYDIMNGYELEVIEEEVWITEKILNISYIKK